MTLNQTQTQALHRVFPGTYNPDILYRWKVRLWNNQAQRSAVETIVAPPVANQLAALRKAWLALHPSSTFKPVEILGKHHEQLNNDEL